MERTSKKSPARLVTSWQNAKDLPFVSKNDNDLYTGAGLIERSGDVQPNESPYVVYVFPSHAAQAIAVYWSDGPFEVRHGMDYVVLPEIKPYLIIDIVGKTRTVAHHRFPFLSNLDVIEYAEVTELASVEAHPYGEPPRKLLQGEWFMIDDFSASFRVQDSDATAPKPVARYCDTCESNTPHVFTNRLPEGLVAVSSFWICELCGFWSGESLLMLDQPSLLPYALYRAMHKSGTYSATLRDGRTFQFYAAETATVQPADEAPEWIHLMHSSGDLTTRLSEIVSVEEER